MLERGSEDEGLVLDDEDSTPQTKKLKTNDASKKKANKKKLNYVTEPAYNEEELEGIIE
jgi:hypothetical protein